VQGLCVVAKKRERKKERTKKIEEVHAVQKNLAAEKESCCY
jgi:hypothetical protein